MKIPILDLKKQYESIKPEVDAAIKKVVESQHFILGEEVERFEQEVARYCGTTHAIGVASGTDALYLVLKAMGIGPGDEVITTPFTFFATAETVSLTGATPVFVDIDPATYCIDPALIEAKITKYTKAIIPVHLYGQCADMDAILAIAKRHKLRVVEDAAQAIGATYRGKRAGSMGDAGCLSFFPSKNLGGFGDGGMIVTSDQAIADAVKMLRVHGSVVRYVHAAIGINSRLDAIQAAVLRVKLKYLDGWLQKRRDAADYYTRRLKGLPVQPPQVPTSNVHTYHLYVLSMNQSSAELAAVLNKAGAEARVYYPIPLHLQECYRPLGYRVGSLPRSERASHDTLAIALYPEITQAEQDFVITTMQNFFAKEHVR